MSDEQEKDGGKQPVGEIKSEPEAKEAAHPQEIPQPQEAPRPQEVPPLQGAEALQLQEVSQPQAETSGQPSSESPPEAAPAVDPEREAKLKAAAEARAARAAAKMAAGDSPQSSGEPVPSAEPAVDPEREAKLKAAEEARAARAAAKAAQSSEPAAPAEPKPPSPKQPQLDEALQLIQALVSEAAVEESYINEMNGDMPTFIIKNEHWTEVAKLFRNHPLLDSNFLRNVSGVDYETYLEVVYHLVSISSKKEYAIKIKADRESPKVASAAPVWSTANWNEREIYDLLGIDFTGHPDLRRIMMPDDWVGHPLRKDYEPLDSEV